MSGGGQYGGGRLPRGGQHTRDVDALAPGLDDDTAQAVDAAADEGAGEGDSTVQGGVRSEGDDHDVMTSVPRVAR